MVKVEIINLVRAGLAPPFRPELPNINAADLDPGMVTLMKDCWAEDPKARPIIGHVKRAVKQIGRGKEGSLLDHALKMMDKYSSSLETTIADRTRQLTEETKKADILLYKFLPKPVADRLKSGCSVDPEAYDSVTILFSDVADFDSIAAKSSPLQLCSLLNDIYYTLDEIIDDYNVFKVRKNLDYRNKLILEFKQIRITVQTINDVYMMASGLKTGKENDLPPTRHGVKANADACGKMHVAVAANLALHIQLTMTNYIIPHLPKERMKIRMGIHTGPAISGVIGSVSPQYCLFGDTVNIASKLLEFGKGSCIHISESTNTYLTEVIGGFVTKPRGEIEGTGTFFTFWLLGKKVKSIEDKTNISTEEDLPSPRRHGDSGAGEHS
uniref:Guanylate cyclase domain-containing protein n=1 Tax=Romanomermis culicivorax TaxID=13658 RepID=A0A915JK97_ROMCU